MRPLVGVAGEALVVRKHFGDQDVVAAPTLIVAGIRAAGGSPVVLPPGTDDLAGLDALVLTGGADLGADPSRDRHELALLRSARRRGLPTLGLCRGLQLMAVGTGGTLLEELGDSHLLPPPGTHRVGTLPGSVVAGLVPEERVGSLHHQAVATFDADLWRCTAIAADGVVEALEWADPEAWTALGVQWHPELDATGPAVFGWLVRVASRSRTDSGQMSCWTGLVNPLASRRTAAATAPPVRVTAS